MEITDLERYRRAQKETFGVLDTQDLKWANLYDSSKAINHYFDYYFSGQDIQVFIDGVPDTDPIAQIPIASLGFQIEQQKAPIYGFWDYVFSEVMRGTRVVNASMTIFSTSTNYMSRLLSAAAKARAEGKNQYALRGLDKDEKLIEQYWTRNINSGLELNETSIFNSHPPFNLVIVYGIQSASISSTITQQNNEIIQNYKDDIPLFTDTNERLVQSGTNDNPMRVILENCEITQMQTQYTPDGQPITETYQFFARDIRTPIDGVEYSRKTTKVL